jgi:hypothetical protein
MAFKDTLERVLALGLAAELDGKTTNPQATANPETKAPAGTVQDRIAGVNFFGGANTQQNILILTAVVVGLLGVVYLIRR